MNLGLGLRLRSVLSSGGTPAPSQIIVATTNAIVLSGLTDGYTSALNGTYTKSGDPGQVGSGGVDYHATGAVYFNPAFGGENRDGAAIWYGQFNQQGSDGWQISFYDDNNYLLGALASEDSTIVPASGYSNVYGYTGTITLTAA